MLQAMPKLAGENDKNPLSLNHLAIPLLISGNMQNPSITLDAGAIAKQIANAHVKKVQTRLQDKIQDEIKRNVSGKAGDLLKNILGS